jgi:putative spermidine/putrescine transport system ATP-binding protein
MPSDDMAVRAAGVGKRFGDTVALQPLDLDIAAGEFFSLLGPSGSGKTTLLRLIAGFEEPSEGSIHLAGRDVTGLAPFERDVSTVFQDYALFPHMSVLDNVEYGLRVRRVGKAERRSRALEALDSVRLADFGERRPSQLSGGQRQRVALARSLVTRPAVLLLDEPLGALDLKLREEMQVELKSLQREVGITFVFVTHDQDEALSMSDRIAVFSEGHIEQVGTPSEIYEHPASAFVAGFVGTSNLLSGEVARDLLGRDGTYLVRPEKILLSGEGGAGSAGVVAPGTVTEVQYVGSETRYSVALDAGASVLVAEHNRDVGAGDAHARRGQRVELSWPADHVVELIRTGDRPGRTGPMPGTPGEESDLRAHRRHDKGEHP